MRNLIKNSKNFYVLNYLGQVEVKDDDGYLTGETTIAYSKPIQAKANISSAKGSSQVEMFGTQINYDKTIVMSTKLFDELGIDENSVLFVDIEPTFDDDENPLYDYRIERIAKAINEVAIAITKVKAN